MKLRIVKIYKYWTNYNFFFYKLGGLKIKK